MRPRSAAPYPSLTTMVARALARRCPRCGARKLFRRWFRIVDRCPGCALWFEREDGYWVGAIIVNTAVTEALFGVLFVATLLVTMPDVDWVPLLAVAVATNALFPFAFYPFSKTLWMALDLHFHPRRDG